MGQVVVADQVFFRAQAAVVGNKIVGVWGSHCSPRIKCPLMLVLLRISALDSPHATKIEA